jgi:hypothetical protein
VLLVERTLLPNLTRSHLEPCASISRAGS